MEKQLLLFEFPEGPQDKLFKAIAEIKESHRKTQKRLFGEVNSLNKRLTETQAQVDKLLFKLGMVETKYQENTN